MRLRQGIVIEILRNLRKNKKRNSYSEREIIMGFIMLYI